MKGGFIILLVLLFLAIAGLLLPKEYNVEQSITVDSIAIEIHPYVNDLRQWPKWSPWQKGEQAIKIFYGNVTRGIGATQSWQGPSNKGRLKLTASSPENGIAYDIYFNDRNTPSISAIQYHKLSRDKTRVTWRLHGEVDVPVIGGFIALIISYRTSGMFLSGLQNLKRLVEQETQS